eukprot:scaffold233942_cov21-Tisochrysis_lutea.AAC.1
MFHHGQAISLPEEVEEALHDALAGSQSFSAKQMRRPVKSLKEAHEELEKWDPTNSTSLSSYKSGNASPSEAHEDLKRREKEGAYNSCSQLSFQLRKDFFGKPALLRAKHSQVTMTMDSSNSVFCASNNAVALCSLRSKAIAGPVESHLQAGLLDFYAYTSNNAAALR